MATVAPTDTNALGANALSETTLAGTDDFVYTQGVTKYLIVRNPTGSQLNITIDGDGATTQLAPGVGNVDISGGFQFTVAANSTSFIDLDTIRSYLSGTIAMTGGGSGIASILEV